MADRVNSAVQFLQDPTVSSAPLPQRIDFLKSKGLTEAEIEQALAQAARPPQSLYGPAPHYAGHPPERGRSDWRDWLIISIVGGGTAYVLSQIAKRYLFPALSPPDATQLQEATAALEAKYDEAAALLQQLKADSEAVKATMDTQNSKVDGAVDQVTEALQAFQVKERQREEEFMKAKEEIESLKELLNKSNERQAKDQASSMADIQAELKSLRSLLGSQQQRSATPGGGKSPGGPSTPASESAPSSSSAVDPPKFGITSFSGKGGLPAWQLAGHQRLNQMNGTSTSGASESKDPESGSSSSSKTATTQAEQSETSSSAPSNS